MRILLVTGLQF